MLLWIPHTLLEIFRVIPLVFRMQFKLLNSQDSAHANVGCAPHVGTSKEVRPTSLSTIWALGLLVVLVMVCVGGFSPVPSEVSHGLVGLQGTFRRGCSPGLCFLFRLHLLLLLPARKLWSCDTKLLEVLQMHCTLWCLCGNDSLSQHLLNTMLETWHAFSYLILTVGAWGRWHCCPH